MLPNSPKMCGIIVSDVVLQYLITVDQAPVCID